MIDKIPDESLPRWQKILLVLFDLSKGTKKHVKFEDIVVGAFKKYPETFHLRGYPEYPDSGDLIHKPLYDMRPQGLLTASQKMFSLTDKGLAAAKQLKRATSDGGEVHFKPSREIGKEIDRILSTEGFALFGSGQKEKIVDTDFFQYLGVSVNTSKNDFRNRLDMVTYAVDGSNNFYPQKTSELLNEYHLFMSSKFKDLIDEMSNKKERNV